MLTAPDADIVRRDPGIPGLSIVLDPEAVIAALRPCLPRAGTARMTYVRYKPGRSCVVAYRLDGDGGLDLYAKASPPGAPAEPRMSVGRSSASDGTGRIILGDGAIAVCVFPVDHKLKALRRLVDAELRRRMLREVVPDRPDLWDGAFDELRYLPERRYVARWLSGNRPVAVLKLHTEREYALAQRNVTAFRGHASFRRARCLGQSDRRRILLHEWLPGRVLSEAVSDPDPDFGALTSVGAALAHLHAQDATGLAPLQRDVEAATLLGLSANLGSICPHLAERLDRLVRRLAGELMRAPRLNRAIHGDFSAGQVLIAGDGVAILDFDRAARGDPAADIGLFIAHLERKALCCALPANRVGPLRQAFLEGYGSVTRRRLPARVPLYIAVGLVRLAALPFRSREADWLAQTEAILERAAAVADEVGGRADVQPAVGSTAASPGRNCSS